MENAMWAYEDPLPDAPYLKGYAAFYWGKMDHWFEEDEEVFVHPRDPYKRVDTAQSSRHVQVVVGGVTVAESSRPVLLFETGLPTRYYLPAADVRMDLLRPSDRRTRCPYKGEASYYSVEVNGQLHQDIAWYYPFPLAEVGRISGRIAFFQERVDALYVDGEEQPRPRTPWSTPQGSRGVVI